MGQVIAEIGSVHDGSFGNACKLIEAAANCGVDMVKFQTHIALAETLRDAPAPGYFTDEPRFEYFNRTGFRPEQWLQLRAHAQRFGVQFLSSPFSIEAVDLLEQIGVQGYKVASGEVTNLPLLERIAATRKPVYLSSGMSNWAEIDAALNTLKTGGPTTLMQCSSLYPCSAEYVGLNVIGEMRVRYGLPVGFSDHTQGMAAAIAAAALGTSVVEKHFTLSRLMYGSDAPLAMEPDDFKLYCQSLREVWEILEHPVNKDDLGAYQDMKRIFEKSVVTAAPVKKGAVLSREHLAFKKPGDGIRADKYRQVIGRRANRDLPADYKLRAEDLE